MVRKIPDGFHTVTPFLNVVGAAQAVDFCQKAFGAEVLQRLMTPAGGVAHCLLQIGDSRIIVEEAVRVPATSCAILLYVDDAWWKRAVDAGAEPMIPVGDKFWGDRWGMVGDRWGTRWGIATHIEDLSDEEIGRRAAQAGHGS